MAGALETELPRGFASDGYPSRAELLDAAWRSPRPSLLDEPVRVTGAKAQKGLAALGIETAGDLLAHYPHRHEDRGEVLSIADLKTGQDATIEVEVRSIETRRAWQRKGLTLTVAKVADSTGPLEAVWFNQPWIGRQLKAGARVVLHGRYEGKTRFRVAEHELGGGGASEAAVGLVPVHPASEGVAPRRLRELALAVRGLDREIPDPLPAALIAAERFASLADAVDAIHFPSGETAYESARRRVAFDELLGLQLELQLRRASIGGGAPATALAGDGSLVGAWRQGLPFRFTGDQDRCAATLDGELAGDQPMARLLMGEVGSGKTAVALHALLRAVESGYQGMLMAPTETLASQHVRSIERMLGGLPVSFSLLTGSTAAAARRRILGDFASGQLSILVGTHALLEDEVAPARLGLCVVDEQHRFGVRQRERLAAKGPEGRQPHVLHMTATPIPRTLALAAYGDLQTMRIEEMPPGRAPVQTHVVDGAAARKRAYERIREEVADGRRAFVVCPLVEASEALEASAAVEERDRLAEGPLSGLAVGLLHGRMTPAQKEQAMADFAAGVTPVLVSTTVIEVGVDVPEATVMLVENAERFGLAQLHQLRGRVGRGQWPGLCLLSGRRENRRLAAMEASTNGFELAELDLELRGEGDLAGVRQSGLPALKAASLPADIELLDAAHRLAGEIVREDLGLESPGAELLSLLAGGGGAQPAARRMAA